MLIQLNPKENDSIFSISCVVPEIKSEKKKIFEKLSEYPEAKILEGKEAKLKDGNVQSALAYLLEK